MKKRKQPTSISFEYIKSHFFRVIHVDGMHGGISPDLDIHMGIFTERWPFPKEVIHPIREDGTLGPEIREKRKTRKGLVREIDADIILDVATAKAMVKWLKEKVEEAEMFIAKNQSKKLVGNGHKPSIQ